MRNKCNTRDDNTKIKYQNLSQQKKKKKKYPMMINIIYIDVNIILHPFIF